MRRITSAVLVLLVGVFFQAGCGGVGLSLAPSGTSGNHADPSSAWPDSETNLEDVSIDFTPFIVGTAVIIASVVSYSFFKAKQDRIRDTLTPEGARIQILIHAEAPENAVFLRDIHTRTLRNLNNVKNDLRNQTARLGGDLVVLDDIQQDIWDGDTWGYIGIGRAYKTRGKSNSPALSGQAAIR